jgi:uncharacterized protein (DUF1501 family)
MTLTRRELLIAGGVGLLASRLRVFASPEPGPRRALVCVFLRGAADGLALVPPVGDPDLARRRPGLGITPILFDAQFGLHPNLAPLAQSGALAVVHAVGLPAASRSHFEAQELVESAGGRSDGWANRCLAQLGGAGELGGLAIGEMLPRSLAGPQPAVVVDRPTEFGVAPRARPKVRDALGRAFEELYAGDDPVSTAGRRALAAAARVKQVADRPYSPKTGVAYPEGRFGEPFRALAQLLKSDLGVRIACLDFGGWDTHANQRAVLDRLTGVLAKGLLALWRDLEGSTVDATLLTMSEFGRTVAENGTGGTDHGRGGVVFALGSRVRAGKVLGRWPGLADGALEDGRDLAITTDVREVLAEVVGSHLGVKDVAAVFPEIPTAHARPSGGLLFQGVGDQSHQTHRQVR